MKETAPRPTQRIKQWNAASPMLVTNAIIALNVGMLVWSLTYRGGSLDVGIGGASPFHVRFGLNGGFVADGEWYRLITSGFVHYGLLHIAMNMYALFQLGLVLERSMHRVNYAALYFAALLGGSAGALLLDPNALTAGASGAVFGLFGAVAIALHRRGVNVMRTSIGPVLVINLLITFAVPGISKGGHLGGLAAGVAVGAIMLRPARQHGFDWAGLGTAIAVGGLAVAVALARVA